MTEASKNRETRPYENGRILDAGQWKLPCSETVCDRTAFCTRRRYRPDEADNGATPEIEAAELEKINHRPSPEPTSSSNLPRS